MKNTHSIIQIDDCLVSEEILTEYFACDYEKCRGCCCIIGDSGAPLEECEAGAIEKNYPVFSPQMRQAGRDKVAQSGFFEIDVDGDMVTPLVPGSEECAYSHFDGDGNCFCSIEKCWFRGETDFRKPISCWLYPIRISLLSNGLRALKGPRIRVSARTYRTLFRQGFLLGLVGGFQDAQRPLVIGRVDLYLDLVVCITDGREL